MTKSIRVLATVLFFFTATQALANDPEKSLKGLKDKLAKLGAPKLGDKKTKVGATADVPELLFGKKVLNNDWTVVDQVKEEFGGTATVFVKHGDKFIRVTTNVLKDGARAVGTELGKTKADGSENPAFVAVNKGDKYCGPTDILGTPYNTCYEAIKDGDKVIGVYYVGYKK